MADQDFNIKVVTTADTTGIKQTSAELDALSRKAAGPDAATLAARQASLRSALTPVPGELGGTVASTEKVAEELKQVETASLFAGINIAKARQEATFLARELATGVPTTRTLSSLLGSLGPYIAGAVGAGFALNRAITANAERQLKVNQELDEQLRKVTELTQKWTQLSRATTTPEGLTDVASQLIPTLEAAKNKFTEFQNAGTSAWKDFSDIFTAGIPGAGKIFENAFLTQTQKLLADYERLKAAAGASIETGLQGQAAFERLKNSGVDEAIRKTTDHLKEAKIVLSTLNPRENLESWIAQERIVQRLTSELDQLKKKQDELRKSGEPTSTQGILQKQISDLSNLPKTLTPLEEKQARDAYISSMNALRDQQIKDSRDLTERQSREIRDRFEKGFPPAVSPLPRGATQIETNNAILIALQKLITLWQ